MNLTEAEQREIINNWLEWAKGKVPISPGIFTASDILEFMNTAYIAGATAWAETAAYFKKCNDEIQAQLEATKEELEKEKKSHVQLSEMYQTALQKYVERGAELSRVKEVLQRIHNPIKWMQDNLQKGETINGEVAIQLSKDAEYLKSIAFEALTEFANLMNKEK